MIISEEEKNRIRKLHKDYSVINELHVPKSGVVGVDSPESEDALRSYDKYEDDPNIMTKDDDVVETKEVTEDSEGEETYHYGEDEGEDHDEERELEHDEDMAPHDRLDAIEKHLDALRKDMSYDEDREDRDEEGTHFESVSEKKKR